MPDMALADNLERIIGWALARATWLRSHAHTTPVPAVPRGGMFSARYLGDDMVHAPRPWRTSPEFPGLPISSQRAARCHTRCFRRCGARLVRRQRNLFSLQPRSSSNRPTDGAAAVGYRLHNYAINFFARWRAARDASHQPDLLLAQADANRSAGQSQQMVNGAWVLVAQIVPSSADGVPSFAEHTRLRLLLRVLDRNPEQASRFAACLRSILRDNDARSLFADTGMAARPGLSGELVARVQTKLLPVAPNRAELADVFAPLFISGAMPNGSRHSTKR